MKKGTEILVFSLKKKKKVVLRSRLVAMDPTRPSESIYNLIPSDWKEPPPPPRYVGNTRLSLETRMRNNSSVSGLIKASYDF